MAEKKNNPSKYTEYKRVQLVTKGEKKIDKNRVDKEKETHQNGGA